MSDVFETVVITKGLSVGTSEDSNNVVSVRGNSILLSSSNLPDGSLILKLNTDSSLNNLGIEFQENNVKKSSILFSNGKLNLKVGDDFLTLSDKGIESNKDFFKKDKPFSLVEQVFVDVDYVLDDVNNQISILGDYLLITDIVYNNVKISKNQIVSFNGFEISIKYSYDEIPLLVKCNDFVYIKSNKTFTLFENNSMNIDVGCIFPTLSNKVPSDFLMLNGQKVNKVQYYELWEFALINNLTTRDISLDNKFVDLNDFEFSVPNFKNKSLISYDKAFNLLDIIKINYSDGNKFSSSIVCNFIIKAKNLPLSKKLNSENTLDFSSKKDSNFINVEVKKLDYNNGSLLSKPNLLVSGGFLTSSSPFKVCFYDGKLSTVDYFSIDLSNVSNEERNFIIKEEVFPVYITKYEVIESFDKPINMKEGQIWLSLNDVNSLNNCSFKKVGNSLVPINFLKIGEVKKTSNDYEILIYKDKGFFIKEFSFEGKSLIDFNHNLGCDPRMLSFETFSYKDGFVSKINIPTFKVGYNSFSLDISELNLEIGTKFLVKIFKNV